MSNYMSASEVAAFMKVPLSSVHFWCMTGHLPASSRDKQFYILKADLDDFIQHRFEGIHFPILGDDEC